MAIKRPITKKATREEREEEDEPKKPLKKRAVEEEEDEPALKKKKHSAEEEEDDAPKKKKKSSKSFADMFDATKPGGKFPVGDFKMRIVGFELEGEIADDTDDQGELKAKITYEGHENEEDVAEKTISNWYNLADEDGKIGPGVPFLKGDLDVLGYEDVMLADLEEIFSTVEKERPEVIVKVKQNGQYTNAFLQGLADGE